MKQSLNMPASRSTMNWWVLLTTLLISSVSFVGNAYYRLQSLQEQVQQYYHPYLANLGLTDNFYIVYFFALEVIVALGFTVTGIIIIWQRSNMRIAIFTAITLMLYGITIPPSMHALVVNLPQLPLPLRLIRGVGLGLFVILFYIFPTGRFVPRWTGIMAVSIAVWSLVWPFYAPANPYLGHNLWPFFVLSLIFGTGVLAQLYRYFRVVDQEQKQQTKWVVFGLTVSVLGDFITHVPWHLWHLQHGSDLLFLLIHHPFFALSQLLVPLSIGFSILKYGLWEIDFILNRTLVYGLITTFMAVVWAITVKTLEQILLEVVGRGALPLATGGAVLVGILVFRPAYNWLEAWSNRFNPQKIDFSHEFVEFLPDVRNVISLTDMVRVLVSHTVNLTQANYGALFLYDSDRNLQLVDVQNMTPDSMNTWRFDPILLEPLQQGYVIQRAPDCLFTNLIPLLLPREKQPELIGLLALGPRQNHKGYSTQERNTFKALSKEAGIALYIAQLNANRRGDLKNQLAILQERLSSLPFTT